MIELKLDKMARTFKDGYVAHKELLDAAISDAFNMNAFIEFPPISSFAVDPISDIEAINGSEPDILDTNKGPYLKERRVN